MADGDTPRKKSDLGIRTASAIVMLLVAGTAFWFGGWLWVGFVGLVALTAFMEWRGLAAAFTRTALSRTLWLTGGALYIGLAAALLVYLRGEEAGYWLIMLVLAVIGTDIGAYFLGRTIGGPKIAPKLSPSKTWAGLAGGILGAWIFTLALETVSTAVMFSRVGESFGKWAWMTLEGNWGWTLLLGCLVAPSAQAGDFFESWMKRRAGVKDSSNLIPGHGGVFDRVDGLLAVSAVIALYMIIDEVVFA